MVLVDIETETAEKEDYTGGGQLTFFLALVWDYPVHMGG